MSRAPAKLIAEEISALYQSGEICDDERRELTSMTKTAMRSGDWQEIRLALFQQREKSLVKVVLDRAIDATR